jgi:ribosome recycling factor
MDEEVKFCMDEATEKMDKAISHLQDELMRIRAGKATTALLDGITVDYYGVLTPLSQVSNLSTPDAKTIIVQPWDKSMIEPIEKAIMQANIGLNPANNGEIIRIVVPPLTEERRRDLVKQIKSLGENTKVSIRNSRRDANEEIKRLQKEGLAEDLAKDAENEVQDITNDYTKKIDDMVASREKDIMTI